jgi:polysaccharide pyruvyl transferase
MMRIFLMGATPSFTTSKEDTIESCLAKTGGNTGNQLIAYGLLRALKYEIVAWDHSVGANYVSENFDIIVIAAANFLYPGFDFSGMANFIASTKLPCLMVGLGAQSSDYSLDIPLHPGTLRLVQIVSERSACIGVRGPYTADVLARKGIKNVQIIGCPSYYMSLLPNLAPFRARTTDILRVAINGSRDVCKHAFNPSLMISCLQHLVRQAVSCNYDFIAQTEIDEMYLASSPTDPLASDYFRRFQRFFCDIAPPSSLASWLRSHIRVFWDVEEWLRAMNAYDFVIGTRFHGAIAAIQSRVPSCVICHDTRTTEMCEVMGIPSLALQEYNENTVKEVYSTLRLSALHLRYETLYSEYIQFYERNGIAHRLGQ